MNSTEMLIIGHRGWPRRFPDNVLAGIAAAQGVADMVEVDIRVTADRILVLSHDSLIGGRPVGEWQWDDLADLDLGQGHHPLSLSDLLAAFPSFPFNLEVKNFPGEPGFESEFEVALETARRARPGDLVSCFSWPTVDAVRARYPGTDTGLLIDFDWDASVAVEHALEMGHTTIIPHWQLALRSPEALARAVASRLRIVVWTLNNPDLITELASLGVTAIITDDPGLMRRALTDLQKETSLTIKEELASELKDAMKSKDARRRDVIRMIETEVSMARTAPGFSGEVDDNLYRKAIAGYAKKMDKARLEYEGLGERGAEMAQQLEWEVGYLSRWLPKKLDEAATAELVRATIAQLGVERDSRSSGRVIGHIMKSHKDEVDGGLVNRLVAAELADT